MIKKILTALLLLALPFSSVFSQNTVGTILYEPSEAFEGFNLVYPHNQSNIYLMNNCGEIVNTWTDSMNFRPGSSTFLLSNGNLLKAKADVVVNDDPIYYFGGNGEFIEIRDWDNNLLYSFELNDSMFRLHHDIVPMSNGNILASVWEKKTMAECIQAGRDTSNMSMEELWPEMIIEIDPVLDSIVWEWHAWEHVVQDFDSSKDNYGVISDHPELIDLNYDRNNGHADWLHFNALDYNAMLDQILISSPFFDEIWIIDHSTTTAQASGHVGGQGNIGGDLMYRWGNPLTYESGDSTDQNIFFSHSAHWIDNFIEAGHPHYGKIGLFNNRYQSDVSAACILSPPWDMYSWSYLKSAGKFLPDEFESVFTHPQPQQLHSHILSNMQVLPNDNLLVFAGSSGTAYEFNESGEIVWKYILPIRNGFPVSQGDTLNILDNLSFRMTRYPSDFPAFSNKDMSGKGYLEINPDTNACDITAAIVSPNNNEISIYPNPAQSSVKIENSGSNVSGIEIYNILGQNIMNGPIAGGKTIYIDVSLWEEGIYVIRSKKAVTHKLLIQR